jgi:secreted Zn-dependent insulinase-like peptidase
MKVMLISDPDAEMSAASLNVDIGAALDTAPYYGTAHFLEHMLFQGTEKYPEYDAYKRYLADNSGSSNAFTTMANTNYHFEVSNDAFEGALDRFS